MDYLYLSKKLKELRAKHGLSQQELATYLHVDRSTYAYYESGKTAPSFKQIIHLANLYEIDLNCFVDKQTDYEPRRTRAKNIHDQNLA